MARAQLLKSYMSFVIPVWSESPSFFFFFQAEDGIRDQIVTGVQTCALPILLTHIYGVKEHGLAYFKHFLGPSPALIPLMLPIELISHVARPLSLTVRLMGNMMADHKVVMSDRKSVV